jgi:hypothetical protein
MNVWKQFENLLPKDPILVGTVTSHNSGNTSTVSFVSGGTAVVDGQSVAIGLKAFVQSNRIQSEAPDLTLYVFELAG